MQTPGLKQSPIATATPSVSGPYGTGTTPARPGNVATPLSAPAVPVAVPLPQAPARKDSEAMKAWNKQFLGIRRKIKDLDMLQEKFDSTL